LKKKKGYLYSTVTMRFDVHDHVQTVKNALYHIQNKNNNEILCV